MHVFLTNIIVVTQLWQ